MMEIASLIEIVDEIQGPEFEELLERATYYAFSIMKGRGFIEEPRDIVFSVVSKLLEEDRGRNWNKTTNPNFANFFLDAVKSEVSNLSSKNSNRREAEQQVHEWNGGTSSEWDHLSFVTDEVLTGIKSHVKSLGGSDLEELILDCWAEGIEKQQDASDFLEVSISEIQNAYKRLRRRLATIRKASK